MATRVLGPKGSKKRRRFLFVPILLVMCTALFYVSGALGVHDENVFQLDGNALTSAQSTPNALEDWDLICKANRVQVGTLNAAINATQTSIQVNETQSLPGVTLPVNIQIGSEQMTVTARSGATNPRTYTVTRHIDGTSAAVASSGAAVFSGCLFQHGYVATSGATAGAPPAGSTLSNPSKFIVDQSNNTVDDILKGGTADDNDIPSWKWNSAGSLDKNDLTDGYAAEYTCKGSETNSVPLCSGTAGDKLLYFGADRYGISGSANVAFWLFQHRVVEHSNAGAPAGQCTDNGGCLFTDQNGNSVSHKVGNVSLGGTLGTGCDPASLAAHPTNVCTPGDLLVIGAFGPHATLNVFEWVGPNNATKNYNGTSQCFTAVCSLQPLLVDTNGDCGPSGAGSNDNACAVANTTVAPSPWILPQKNIQGKAVGDQFNTDTVHGLSTFFEGGINLTGLGVGGACFSSFLINSRSSAAGDSELHDKILGSFQRCSPALTTQQSVTANNDGTPGTVQPGTAVTDIAKIAVTGATSPDDATGTVNFTLCGPLAAMPTATPPAVPPNLCDVNNVGTVGAGTSKTLNNTNCDPDSPNSTDGISCAVSDSVNGTGHELANGYYCFKATASLTNYDNPDPATNNTTECFRVLKLNTSLVTNPQDSSGTSETGATLFVKDSPTVYDHAVITGAAGGGFPDGTVKFYLCDPDQTSLVNSGAGTEFCDVGNGTLVDANNNGGAVSTTHVANETIKTEATSAGVSFSATSKLGVWCFRAEFTSTTAVYNDSKGGDHTECFTIANAASATSAQDWLPNDQITITSDAGSIAGTITVKLLKGGCDPSAQGVTEIYTDGSAVAFTADADGNTYTTNNQTHKVTAAGPDDYYWRAVFTPTSSFAGGVITKCEHSTLTITN